MKKIYILTSLFFFMISFQTLFAQQNKDGLFISASDGNGNINLLWFVPVDKWPAKGWQLRDSKGNIIRKQILPMSKESMADLTSDQADSIIDFIDAIHNVQDRKNVREQLNGFLALTVLSSFKKARALGLAITLKDIGAGEKVYSIVGLDKNTNPKGIILRSDPVNSKIATPLPPAPEKLRAESSINGAQLFWQPVKDNPDMPVLTYGVERVETIKINYDNDIEIIMLGSSWNQDMPAFTDTSAPVEQDLSYKIYSIDALGRKSKPGRISFFMKDQIAMLPPVGIKVVSKKKKIMLFWQADKNPNRAGYVVERSTNRKGFYDTLTLKGLKPDVEKFEDTDVIEGLSYYYRIRSIGSRGDLGRPSTPVKAIAELSGKPPAPTGLAAEINPVLVILRWEKSKFPAAGYIVEKRAEKSKEWARLNAGIISQRFYKDRYSYDSYGKFYYRVTAVSFDNKKSRPSKEHEVVKENLSRPLKPYIVSIKSNNGKVILNFEPGDNENQNVSFKIIRDSYKRHQGRVIKQGIVFDKRTFTDEDVVPGKGYWYAVAAVDKQNHESLWSDKHLVMVVPEKVPTPDKPMVKFIKKPFSHVEISFEKPPSPLLVVSVQRKTQEQEFWTTIQADLAGTNTAIDTDPVTEGISKYRIIYHHVNGGKSDPSKPAALDY